MNSLKRPPPFYKVFAADDMAASGFFMLTLAERGLLDSMQRQCWIEGVVNTDPRVLAKMLRVEVAEVEAALTYAVLLHFEEVSPGLVRSRELTRQWSEVVAARKAMSEGGKVGAAATNSARTDPSPKHHNGVPRKVGRRVPREGRARS